MAEKVVQPLPEMMTVDEVAELLGVTPRTIWNWRYAGEMAPATKIRGRVLWRRSEINRWLDEHTEKPA